MLDAPGFQCAGWLRNRCGHANDLSGDECIWCTREVDVDRFRVDRAIHSWDDKSDELSAQFRDQMTAPPTSSTAVHQTGVPNYHESDRRLTGRLPRTLGSCVVGGLN